MVEFIFFNKKTSSVYLELESEYTYRYEYLEHKIDTDTLHYTPAVYVQIVLLSQIMFFIWVRDDAHPPIGGEILPG